MSNFFLPKPTDLTRTRSEIVAAKAAEMKSKLDTFCKNELGPAIIRANDSLKTEISFRLPNDIPVNEFQKYVDGFNDAMTDGTKYVLTTQDNGQITLCWAEQK